MTADDEGVKSAQCQRCGYVVSARTAGALKAAKIDHARFCLAGVSA